MAERRHVHDHDDVAGLLSVEDARRNVLSEIHPLAPLQLPLTEAFGCVIAEDVIADRDLPEFASSAMDGFAVRAPDTYGASEGLPTYLALAGEVLMGQAAARIARRAEDRGQRPDRAEAGRRGRRR